MFLYMVKKADFAQAPYNNLDMMNGFVVIAKILILFLFRLNPLGSQIELLIDVKVVQA
jgi:hypothetical protein